MVGAQMNQAALAALAAASAAEAPSGASASAGMQDASRRIRREDNEPILIPTSNAPAWMVGGVVLTALALALVAGYYLLPASSPRMLRHALRRLLWIVPILIGVTLASFALLSYLPDPADDPALLGTLTAEQLASLRRARFLDLPRFFNERPLDVAGRVEQTLPAHARGRRGRRARRAPSWCVSEERPYPICFRASMRCRPPRARKWQPRSHRSAPAWGSRRRKPAIREQSVAFWNRFWTDRAPDFRPANARRAVRRFAQHASSTREGDVIELDTYALEQIMLLLDELASPSSTIARANGATRKLASAPSSDSSAPPPTQPAARTNSSKGTGCSTQPTRRR